MVYHKKMLWMKFDNKKNKKKKKKKLIKQNQGINAKFLPWHMFKDSLDGARKQLLLN